MPPMPRDSNRSGEPRKRPREVEWGSGPGGSGEWGEWGELGEWGEWGVGGVGGVEGGGGGAFLRSLGGLEQEFEKGELQREHSHSGHIGDMNPWSSWVPVASLQKLESYIQLK